MSFGEILFDSSKSVQIPGVAKEVPDESKEQKGAALLLLYLRCTTRTKNAVWRFFLEQPFKENMLCLVSVRVFQSFNQSEILTILQACESTWHFHSTCITSITSMTSHEVTILATRVPPGLPSGEAAAPNRVLHEHQLLGFERSLGDSGSLQNRNCSGIPTVIATEVNKLEGLAVDCDLVCCILLMWAATSSQCNTWCLLYIAFVMCLDCLPKSLDRTQMHTHSEFCSDSTRLDWIWLCACGSDTMMWVGNWRSWMDTQCINTQVDAC